MIAMVKELVCDGQECNKTLHFDTALSDDQCRRIAKEQSGWMIDDSGRDVCAPPDKEVDHATGLQR